MRKIRLILSDIGNVLMLADHRRTIEAYIQRHGIVQEIADLYFARPDYAATGTGLMSWHEYCDRLRSDWKIDLSDTDIFRIDGSHIYAIDWGMMDLLDQVMRKTPVAFATNTRYPEWERYLHLQPRFRDEFATWRSDVAGCYKNHSGIFQNIVAHWIPAYFGGLTLQPEQVLFIDDSQANCEAAAAAGLQTFQYTEQHPWLLEEELRRLGI